MLDKDIVKFIITLKQDKNNSGKSDIERAKDFISDLYRIDTVSDNRLLLELKHTFCEVLRYIKNQEISYFMKRYFEIKEQAEYLSGIKEVYNPEIYALTQSIRLLPVKRDNEYINGFCAENMED